MDDRTSTRVSVYTGRGLHVESSNVFLWANGVEHHALYQYQASPSNILRTSLEANCGRRTVQRCQ